MKILQINSVCGISSTGRIALDICKEAQKQGHVCKIAYGEVRYANTSNGIASYEIDNRLDCIMHAVLTRITDRHGRGSVRATKKLIHEIEAFEPDVIHLHNLHGYYLNYPLLFKYIKTKKIKIFWTLHDCWAFTGHCVYFDYVGCDRWMEECHHCPQKRNYPSTKLLDGSRANYRTKKEAFQGVENMTIIVPSNWLARRVGKSFLREYPLEVVYNGVDLENFCPTESSFRRDYQLEGKYMVLGVANVWDERKGLKTFAELAARLPEDTVVVLVGLSSEQKQNLPENILGIEHTDSKRELAGIYTTADLFINPSVEETFGLTTIEAMACGTEAIVYKDTACEEIMKECGGTVVDRSIDSLLKEILCRKEEHVKPNTREHVLKFSNSMFCRKIVELYEK